MTMTMTMTIKDLLLWRLASAEQSGWGQDQRLLALAILLSSPTTDLRGLLRFALRTPSVIITSKLHRRRVIGS